MPNITFQVIDVNCEQADQSFFVPHVSLLPKSTTVIQSWLGYDEFIPSTPPKRYKKITFTGFSERVAFTAEQTPNQCGGAKYVYGGTGEIDIHGNVISKWTKNFYAQCSKQFWPQEPLQTVPGAITTQPSVPFPKFVGYCWPTDPSSCPTCDPSDANWPFIGNFYTNVPQIDLGAFIFNVNDPVVTSTSWSVNDVFHGLTSISRNVPYTATVTGVTWNMSVGITNYTVEDVITNPTPLTFPVKSVSGIFGEYINFTDTNNYSAVLSDEYTDLDAAAAAQTINGTSATAQNTPRGNTFFSRTTSVIFTLLCTDLVSGKDYIVTVDLWDRPSNTHTTKSYGFTASDVTHSITDTVPTPSANHTITIQKPTIAFAP